MVLSGAGENLMNIVLDTDGQIAVGGRNGDIYLTDESLATVQTIQTKQQNTFVTFNHYISPVQVLSVSDVTVKGTTTYSLNEYTLQGVLISTQPIPQVPGATENENARGLSVDPSGNIDIYDGTSTRSLAILSARRQTWSYQTFSGWNTVNTDSYGEVATYNNFVFASDMKQPTATRTG